ncbi:MAG TPA: hypothetical protein VH394_20990 [Thermoanaerobaculia bacterium]|jgi:hypothetical protein|nr:hypothetical protein [Thermoanaerobaculia bacterium]
MATVSFENDLAPLLKQFRGNMIWRFDLTSYDDVKTNFDAIFGRIEKKGMPPPPYPPLTDEQIAMFKAWQEQGFPR